ncbi:MAG: outer membrane protein assembly factor BamA, partial [Burkholderiaceae bacterium]|nr:outer membrane protein assembly factor BamA [Burkholderiaceae bacterium]
FTVKERPTGSIQAGIGYSSTDKVVLQASYSQQNVFGSGQSISLEANTSRANKTIALTHVDPYVTLDGISRTTEIYQRRSDLARLGLGTVDFTQRGGAMRFGVPFTEFDTVYFGLGYEGTDIGLTDRSPPAYVKYVNDFGERTDAAIATLGWARDSRDNLLVPNRGRYQRLFVETALPTLDLRYYRSTYQFQQFVPLTNKYTFATNLELGWGGGYGGRPYPLFKNFYAGGIGSVRGFEGGSLGPRDALGNPTGGTRRLNLALEALAPLPGADRTLRVLAFLDGGQVWNAQQRVRLGDLRYSAGIGLAWVSPIGPLKLSYGYPLKREPGDRPQRFQFQIGTGF